MPRPDPARDSRDVTSALPDANLLVVDHQPGGSNEGPLCDRITSGTTVLFVANGDPSVDRTVARDVLAMGDRTATLTAAVRLPDNDRLLPDRGKSVDTVYEPTGSSPDRPVTPGALLVAVSQTIGTADAAGHSLAIEFRVLPALLTSESLMTVTTFLRTLARNVRESDVLAMFVVPRDTEFLGTVQYFPDVFDVAVRSKPPR